MFVKQFPCPPGHENRQPAENPVVPAGNVALGFHLEAVPLQVEFNILQPLFSDAPRFSLNLRSPSFDNDVRPKCRLLTPFRASHFMASHMTRLFGRRFAGENPTRQTCKWPARQEKNKRPPRWFTPRQPPAPPCPASVTQYAARCSGKSSRAAAAGHGAGASDIAKNNKSLYRSLLLRHLHRHPVFLRLAHRLARGTVHPLKQLRRVRHQVQPMAMKGQRSGRLAQKLPAAAQFNGIPAPRPAQSTAF